MARKLRVQFEGAIYHVTLRGVERRVIFTEDRERERFLERVEVSELREQRHHSPVRPITAKMLCKHGGLTQRDVAQILGVGTGAAVCLQLKKLPALMEDQSVARAVRKIDRRLAKVASGKLNI